MKYSNLIFRSILLIFLNIVLRVFNQCANEDLTLATLALWGGVHPMLKTLPTDWECSVSYGLLHSPESAEHVREFLEAIEEVLDEQLLEGQ